MPPPVSDKNRLRVLRVHAANPGMSTSMIALRVGLSRRTVERILADQKPAVPKGE